MACGLGVSWVGGLGASSSAWDSVLRDANRTNHKGTEEKKNHSQDFSLHGTTWKLIWPPLSRAAALNPYTLADIVFAVPQSLLVLHVILGSSVGFTV